MGNGTDRASHGLARLAALMSEKKLHARVDATMPFAQIAEASEKLWNRGVTGKIVVTL